MYIENIKDFVILTQTGNYLEASDKLFISQSTLSRHIKLIEDELGTPLFDRTGNTIILNEAGLYFLSYAEQIVKLYDETLLGISKIRKASDNSLNVAAIPSLYNIGILNLFSDFQNKYPEYKLNYFDEDSDKITEMLYGDKCDIAFLRQKDKKNEDFIYIPFLPDHLAVILPNSHPLSKEKSITLEQIKHEPFILLGREFMYQYCLEACQLCGFTPHVAYTGFVGENNINLVRKGLGVALFMKKAANAIAPADVAVIDIRPKLPATISIVYKRTNSLSASAAAFIQLALETADQYL